ncbi:hypothetical protein D3C86_2148450 [compost metagenome]
MSSSLPIEIPELKFQLKHEAAFENALHAFASERLFGFEGDPLGALFGWFSHLSF